MVYLVPCITSYFDTKSVLIESFGFHWCRQMLVQLNIWFTCICTKFCWIKRTLYFLTFTFLDCTYKDQTDIKIRQLPTQRITKSNQRKTHHGRRRNRGKIRRHHRNRNNLKPSHYRKPSNIMAASDPSAHHVIYPSNDQRYSPLLPEAAARLVNYDTGYYELKSWGLCICNEENWVVHYLKQICICNILDLLVTSFLLRIASTVELNS